MSILIVSGIEGVQSCADSISKQLAVKVEVADGRRAAVAALRHHEFSIVIVDETLAECDPEGAEAIWARSSLAIPLQINFALSGAARIVREVRAALQRREREQCAARRAASFALESQVKDTIAGLLLHSELALAQPDIPHTVAEKLRVVSQLAGSLCRQLTVSPQEHRATR